MLESQTEIPSSPMGSLSKLQSQIVYWGKKKGNLMSKKISMNLKYPFSALISAFLLVGVLYVLLHVDL